MSCCACCCFYPKYKRKVDNIYPRSYELPLVKIEVEKLQYYVKQHPEKLSKIGEYLYQHLKWGLNGTYKNRNYVKNTIEAVDKILFVITPQNLNYYATNYLKIIQKLLEQGAPTSSTNNNNNTGTNNNNSSSASSSNNNVNNNNNDTNNEYLEYQKLAADLFRKFCEKEAANESTTNYNLNYDTFVCQFSSMCYNNNKDELARAELRSSGLQCLATMVKRLVPEDSLRATYLWENMNKIVPALLFIMHETFIENLKQRGSSQSQVDSDENQLLPYLDNDFNSKNKYLNQFQQQQSVDNQIDYDSSQVTINRNDLDSVKIEFTRNNNNNKEPGSAKVSGKGSTKSSCSVNDEQNAMLQHKYSTNLITTTTTATASSISNPDHEAKMLLKHLACRADYTTISKIVKPILDYLDTNKASGWEHIGFIRCIFLILMYNVKQQHAIVIKELIKHLDSHINSSAKLKCRIIGAISVCIRTAAMHSVGTTGQIIEIFTYFIKHLKLSVERQAQLRVQLLQKNLNNKSSNSEIPTMNTFLNNNNNGENNNNFNKIQMDLSEEQNLQAKIIEAMGQFTINLPDYSKNDVITLIAHQISSQQFNYTDLTSILNTNQQLQQQNAKDQLNTQLRGKYFECLYEISTKYRPSQLFSAFTNGSFLEDILRLTLVADWASSRRAHEIIQHLLDKNQLLSRIKKLKPSFFNDYSKTFVYGSESTSSFKIAAGAATAASAATNQQMKTFLSQLNLNETTNKFEISREDIQFMRKNGRMLLGHLNENLFLLNNRRENFESIYITTCLIIFGLFNENEFLIDLIRFGFHVQELALLNYEHAPFSFSLQCSVHKFVCAYFFLLGKSSGCAALIDYCLEICEKRMKKGVYHYIFPEYILLDRRPASCLNGDDSMDTDFKRDLQQSAKEYYNSIDKTTTQETINELDTSIKDEDDQTVTSSTVTTKTSSKMAPWLFCKKTIGSILDKSGFQSIGLFNQSKDFSLSFNYLQQTIKTVQTALKYRSPYSNSFDSLSNIRHEISMQNIINNPDLTNGMTNGVQGHSRMNSKSIGGGVQPNNLYQMRESPSFHQIGTTPRRSIDNDSYLDDDTSYDSMSQISIDQQQPQNDNKLFFIDPSDDINQLTINSFSFSTKQQYQDMSSFETIKRLISNGTGNGNNNNNRTSGATSLIGNALPTANSGISASSISKNMTNLRNSTGASVIVAAAKLEQSSTEDQESNNSSSETIETNQRIINEFKQKPFDELKQTLLRSNNLNQEKYQQVFDSISKEIIVNRDNLILQQHQQLNNNTTSNNSSLNGSNPNLNDSVYIKETNIQQKLVTNLNDIDFPQLFMY